MENDRIASRSRILFTSGGEALYHSLLSWLFSAFSRSSIWRSCEFIEMLNPIDGKHDCSHSDGNRRYYPTHGAITCALNGSKRTSNDAIHRSIGMHGPLDAKNEGSSGGQYERPFEPAIHQQVAYAGSYKWMPPEGCTKSAAQRHNALAGLILNLASRGDSGRSKPMQGSASKK